MKRVLLLIACLIAVVSASYAQTAATTTTTTAAPANDLAIYAGTYTFASGSPISTYSVTVKDGALHGDAGMGNYKLVKQEKADQFQSTSSYGSIITFTRDAKGAVTGLTLAAQGQEISATKDK